MSRRRHASSSQLADARSDSEVKSHSAVDRILIVFCSPSGIGETGLLVYLAEKTTETAAHNAEVRSSLESGLGTGIDELAGISADFQDLTQ